jgi:hypothetical protein
MKKYLRDQLGRPIPRLFFEDPKELDAECEDIIGDFMQRRYGSFRLPIPTQALIQLIDEEADDLDLYAQLPDGVEGLTDFFTDRRPNVPVLRPRSSKFRVSRLVSGC